MWNPRKLLILLSCTLSTQCFMSLAVAGQCSDSWKTSSASNSCINVTVGETYNNNPFQPYTTCQIQASCAYDGTHAKDPGFWNSPESQNRTNSNTSWMVEDVSGLVNCSGNLKLKC